MVSLGTVYVIFKKCVALISAIMLLVVGSDEKNTPDPDGAEIIAKNTYVLYDYRMSNQGVTNDGKYFYFSGTENLGKADMETGEIFLIMIDAIPEELEAYGCNHIGGLSYHDGIIYAAIEDGPNYFHPFIALYDAETLEFTGKYYELPHDLHLEGVPWCAVDAERNCLYTAEWSNAKVLNVFDLDSMKLINTISLSESVDRVQGAEMFGGKLYMSCDGENGKKRILSVDVETGLVNTAFIRNVGAKVEAEGLTVYGDENGKPVFCVLDVGERRKSTGLTRYKLAD